MNQHTEAVIDAMHRAGSNIEGNDEGEIAYYLRDWFTDPMYEDEAAPWIAANLPCWVNFGQVNWAEVARNVQGVSA